MRFQKVLLSLHILNYGKFNKQFEWKFFCRCCDLIKSDVWISNKGFLSFFNGVSFFTLHFLPFSYSSFFSIRGCTKLRNSLGTSCRPFLRKVFLFFWYTRQTVLKLLRYISWLFASVNSIFISLYSNNLYNFSIPFLPLMLLLYLNYFFRFRYFYLVFSLL